MIKKKNLFWRGKRDQMVALVNIYNNCSIFFTFFRREKQDNLNPDKPTQHQQLANLTSPELRRIRCVYSYKLNQTQELIRQSPQEGESTLSPTVTTTGSFPQSRAHHSGAKIASHREALLKRSRYDPSYRGHVTTWLLKATVLQRPVFMCESSPLLKAFLKLWTCPKLQGHSKMQPVDEAQSERAALAKGKLLFCSQWDVTAHADSCTLS